MLGCWLVPGSLSLLLSGLRPPNQCLSRCGAPSPPTMSVAEAATAVATPPPAPSQAPVACRYDHLQWFVDELQPLSHYKAIEDRLNEFARLGTTSDTVAAREAWRKLGPAADPEAFQVHGRDLVEQLLYGFGWRITGQYEGPDTRSLLLSTVDPSGVRFVVTCNRAAAAGTPSAEQAAQPLDHFGGAHLERHFSYHNGAQGIGVLGFELGPGQLDLVQARYEAHHPTLIKAPPHAHADGTRVLDVFAYYRGESGVSDADPGTLIRFVERTAAEDERPLPLPLPGLVAVAAEFEPFAQPAYADHWVSNVVSRVGFLTTLEETLGFTPKVDFNAGVVAAGEAQIESTVTGNASPLVTTDPALALRDRAQVFLPTNNALSPVGHVHWYLEQLGQGIQHVASRVASLPSYVQRANDYRAITGEGVTFLNIPRTYYGLLEPQLLVNGGVGGELLGDDGAAALSDDEAAEVIAALGAAGLVDKAGAVSLDADDAAFDAALLREEGEGGARSYRAASDATRAMVLRVLRRACYVNLWKLMGEQLPEATYLSIVRNKILIDVQGEDVLMQIFTSVVLQRAPGEEAPFLEFIQRVCAQCADGTECADVPIKPGCGGFGIRNFLTLFLSIEVSKAMLDSQTAADEGREAEAAFHERRVRLFTEQLVEANPILTEISDCMTAEGKALDAGDADAADGWSRRKEAANRALADCSGKYNVLMRELREAGEGVER